MIKEININTDLLGNELKSIFESIAKSKFTAYLVGGTVRDLILEKVPKDIDLVVEKNLDEFSEFLASLFQGKVIKFNNHGMQTFRIINPYKKMTIDVTEFENTNNGLFLDLRRRDFTINSMAIKIKDELDYISNIIDPFDGVVDIEKKIIRYTNKDTVLDDPLRMIRLVRLCSKLGFSVEHETLNYFKDNAVLLNNVSKERIRDEIIEIFSLKNSYKSIFMLDELMLLNVIFPEVEQTINVEQLGLHDKDVYEHLIASLYFVEKLIDDELFEKINADIFAHDKPIIPYIKIATFLHDIGKPGTKEFENEKITFISHDQLGSTIAFDILTRLKFSLKTINYIENLIKHHLRLGHLISLDMEPSDKSLRKLNRDCGEIILELTYLDFADYLATSKFNFDNYIDHYNKLGKIYFRILNIYTEFTKKTLNILNGRQIMEIFGLNEGPEVGRVLHAIEQEVINNGEITKENAIKLAKTILNK
jgi:poly(A) polymerase